MKRTIMIDVDENGAEVSIKDISNLKHEDIMLIISAIEIAKLRLINIFNN